jgi:hypothetical protein
MGLQLYDLAGAEPERRFSPYCWRSKMALAHKGLPFDTIPWRFTDKDVIAFSGNFRHKNSTKPGKTKCPKNCFG